MTFYIDYSERWVKSVTITPEKILINGEQRYEIIERFMKKPINQKLLPLNTVMEEKL